MQVVRSRDELIALARARADKLDTTRLQIDRVAGFTHGYSSKLLSTSQIRCSVRDSLFELLWSLGLRLRVEEGPEATAAVRPHYSRRRRRS